MERVKAIQAKYPNRFVWSASADITQPDAAEALTKAVKDGAQGLGEIKFHVEADGPELRRMYALAGELDVPILVHFQEVPHFEGEGVFSTGFNRFEAIWQRLFLSGRPRWRRQPKQQPGGGPHARQMRGEGNVAGDSFVSARALRPIARRARLI